MVKTDIVKNLILELYKNYKYYQITINLPNSAYTLAKLYDEKKVVEFVNKYDIVSIKISRNNISCEIFTKDIISYEKNNDRLIIKTADNVFSFV